MSILAEERRKITTGGDFCLMTTVQALLEIREASLQVIEAVMRQVPRIPLLVTSDTRA